MNRKLRTALAISGAVTFFIIFLKVFTSLAAAFIGAAAGFCVIWLLAGFFYWLYSKQMYCARKNMEYMNKLASEHYNDKLQQDKT